ncbi:MAG: TadE/TadG family type IV pilus assembly protein [Xanthomonas sp.]
MKIRPTAARVQRQAGQAFPEFLVVIPVFLFLLLLIFQMVLVYRAKTVLDLAALEAARAGAVHHAHADEMRKGLVRGMMPLYATGSAPADVYAAWAKASADLAVHSRIQVVSPSRQAWEQFKERQHDGRFALPNDNLAFRDTTVKAGVNVQDANILKIRVVYHYPLIVPFVDRVLRDRSEPVQGGRHFRIPLEAHAIVRMQTPIDESAPLH